MARIQLRVYIDPGQAEVICKVKAKSGTYERLSAVIDTGAEVSLFPLWLLEMAELTAFENRSIIIDQAGIAGQSVEATETIITIHLEDSTGNVTNALEIPAWFAETNTALLGFAGLLDRSVLHLDMQQRAGWIEVED